MIALMRGHSPGALCEICDKRPGVRMAHGFGMEAWSCEVCSGDEDDSDADLRERDETRGDLMGATHYED